MTGFLERFVGRVERYKEFVGYGRHSGDNKWLLAPGRIEGLVKEGRQPIKTGTIWTTRDDGTRDKQSFYQVPSKRIKPENAKEIYMSNGAYVFVDEDGFQSIGSTFALTKDQAREVNRRIKVQLKKMATNAGNSSK